MRRIVKTTLAAVLGSVVAVSAQASSYDAVAQFSAANPSGPFSYGYGSVGSFTALPDFQASGCVGSPGLSCHNINANAFNLPAVGKNISGSTLTFFTNVVAPNQLFIQPGMTDGQAILRFTAPSAGLFPFFAMFERIDNSDGSGDGTNVGVSINGALPVAGSTLANTRTGSPSSYTLTFGQTLSLAAGDTVDFFVDKRGDTYYDGTGLRVLVPEPASIGLFAMGLLTLGAFARRKRG